MDEKIKKGFGLGVFLGLGYLLVKPEKVKSNPSIIKPLAFVTKLDSELEETGERIGYIMNLFEDYLLDNPGDFWHTRNDNSDYFVFESNKLLEKSDERKLAQALKKDFKDSHIFVSQFKSEKNLELFFEIKDIDVSNLSDHFPLIVIELRRNKQE